jgi:predicted transcriptional regulator
MTTKLSINVSPELYEQLQQMADERGITVVEMIRSGLALYKFFSEHPESDVLLKTGGKVQKLTFP